jgi:HD superfamily phosphohydrolase YqeK
LHKAGSALFGGGSSILSSDFRYIDEYRICFPGIGSLVIGEASAGRASRLFTVYWYRTLLKGIRMKELFQRIWELALPYQDKRDDMGHTEIALNYAQKLVELENGNEDVVIPAIILHDIGWSQMPRERRFLFFDKNAEETEKLSVKLEHQIAGVELARDILNKVDYPADLKEEILEIISQHDTRQGFISRNEGLVRDADKLWRYSRVGFEVDVVRFKTTRKLLCEKWEANRQDPDYFYSESARQIALEELKSRKKPG